MQVDVLVNYLSACVLRMQVGHNIGDEFSYHWWDHVFNQAAKNVTVTNNKV